jgi:hypothetical protein
MNASVYLTRKRVMLEKICSMLALHRTIVVSFLCGLSVGYVYRVSMESYENRSKRKCEKHILTVFGL